VLRVLVGVLDRDRRVLRARHRLIQQQLLVEQPRHVPDRGNVPLGALAQVHVELGLAEERRGRRVVGLVDVLACRELRRVCAQPLLHRLLLLALSGEEELSAARLEHVQGELAVSGLIEEHAVERSVCGQRL